MELGRFMGVKEGTIRNGMEGVKKENGGSILSSMFCCKFMTFGVCIF
jgi:hypothetical protein